MMDQKPEGSRELSPYEVGALLYAPANHKTVIDRLIAEEIQGPYSLALCLEDAISDQAVDEAEQMVIDSLKRVWRAAAEKVFYLPNIFIRVRSAEQMKRIFERLAQGRQMLTGFIAPKFSCGCAASYLDALADIQEKTEHRVYLMPILESQDLIDLKTRRSHLCELKERLDAVKPSILNVRVGGNDFCKEFGVRRRWGENIYQISCISNVLGDIIACFGREYVVSGPVWEYFTGPDESWKEGLRREIRLDMLNGFVGKTVIHPNQIPVVNEMLRVSQEDYEDAMGILGMQDDEQVLVSKSAGGSRMNEFNTHEKWAQKILTLADIYGVRP